MYNKINIICMYMCFGFDVNVDVSKLFVYIRDMIYFIVWILYVLVLV